MDKQGPVQHTTVGTLHVSLEYKTTAGKIKENLQGVSIMRENEPSQLLSGWVTGVHPE